ncbi:L-aspartate oxidase [Rossellomorea vietnamensis]|uniref:L-aspartate oxidase n=1 Tax=Rossellomorea vietnamensis TaxID=218284 RepID=A0A5D4MHU1_9BACI|nr:L-aspartate oxidase [Rossellomorea vietnamensis]TYS00894.1 L-aspartate oxidase [Rossellomorea vietnamensis]
MKKADVIIVGSGLAALQTARELNPDLNVMIITKGTRRGSNSYMAQGGVAAVTAKDDNIGRHYQDTLEAGRGHQLEEEVLSLVAEGQQIVQSLVEEGAPFDRNNDGTLSLGMEGAHSAKRILHCGGDETGRFLIEHFLKTLSGNVTWIEGEMVYKLLRDSQGACIGVKTMNRSGHTHSYYAPSIVMAAGGAGGLYSSTSNHPTVTGDAMAVAFRAGAYIADAEFIQFHPTLLYVDGKTIGLVSEAVRGEGAQLFDDSGERIMEGIHPLKELAPRHVVAQRIFEQRQLGRDVYLSIKNIMNFEKKFPSISAMCKENGIDLSLGRIPVSPGCHFMMGGIVIDSVGKTNVEGLYAVGEAACSGVHGANRLASNSLLEGLVYGKRLAGWINAQKRPILFNPMEGPDTLQPVPARKSANPFDVKDFQERMMESAGIIRDGTRLEEHLNWLQAIGFSLNENLDALEPNDIGKYFMWINSLVVTRAALLRTESRGGHIRSDFQEEDDSFWMKRRIMHALEDGEMRTWLDEQVKAKIYA